jgi:hypothetical protein
MDEGIISYSEVKNPQCHIDLTDSEGKYWETLNSVDIWDSTDALSSLNIQLEHVNFDALAYVKAIESIRRVGISPTALSIEILIKVLLKMEFTLKNLLISPNNYDYSELFYRADYLKHFEDLLPEIAKSSAGSILYLS